MFLFLIIGYDFFQAEGELKKKPSNRLNCSLAIMLALRSLTDLNGMEDLFRRRAVLEKPALVFQTL